MDSILAYQHASCGVRWEAGPPLFIQLPPPAAWTHLLKPALGLALAIGMALPLGMVLAWEMQFSSFQAWWHRYLVSICVLIFFLGLAGSAAMAIWRRTRVLHLPTTIQASIDDLVISAPLPPHYGNFRWERVRIVDLTTGRRGKRIRLTLQLTDESCPDFWIPTAARIDVAALEKALLTALGIARSDELRSRLNQGPISP